jgi:hypothetical protein
MIDPARGAFGRLLFFAGEKNAADGKPPAAQKCGRAAREIGIA